jgi:hypothetical protein
MEGENAKGLVEGGHRRRDDRFCAEAPKCLGGALGLIDLGRSVDIRGDDRPLA